MDFLSTARHIAAALARIPRHWNGRDAILQMKAADSPHWRQMEWIGFYFQFLCGQVLADIMQMPGPSYGRVQFDGFLQVPWDFKAHAMNTSAHQVIVNDSLAISAAIAEYGCLGLILAVGRVEYNDEERSFQKWHNELKGETSRYEQERIRRGAWSRLRKVSFDLRQISFVKISDETLVRSGSFQADFRNSDGSPRRAKVLLDLEKLDQEMMHFVEF